MLSTTVSTLNIKTQIEGKDKYIYNANTIKNKTSNYINFRQSRLQN